MQVVDSDD